MASALRCKGCGAELPFRGAACEQCSPPARPPAGEPEPAAAQAPAAGGEPVLAIPGVKARAGRWVVSGALVIRGDGVYLFFDRSERYRSLARRAADAVAGWATGILGLLVDVAAPEDEGGIPAGAKPAGDFYAAKDRALDRVPELARCPWCLPVPREEIAAATFQGGRFLELALGKLTLELQGAFGDAEARAFMRARGYPAEAAGPPVGKWLAAGAFAAFAAWGAWSYVQDLREANSLAYKHVVQPAAAKVQAAVAEGNEFQHVVVRDGRRYYYFGGGRYVPAEQLTWLQRTWYQGREFAAFIVLTACAAAAFFWFLGRQVSG